MNGIELSMSLIWTPKSIDSMNDYIPEVDKLSLRSLLQETIDNCIKPYTKLTKNKYKDQMNLYLIVYRGYRFEIIMQFVKALSKREKQFITRLLNSVITELGDYEWEGIGIQKETMQACLNRYVLTSTSILKNFQEIDQTYDGHPAILLTNDILDCTTKIDFCFMTVFLGAEKEITLKKKTAIFLVNELINSLDYYEYLGKVISNDIEAQDKYFWDILKFRNFITYAHNNNPDELYSDKFHPISISKGEDLSKIICRERR